MLYRGELARCADLLAFQLGKELLSCNNRVKAVKGGGGRRGFSRGCKFFFCGYCNFFLVKDLWGTVIGAWFCRCIKDEFISMLGTLNFVAFDCMMQSFGSSHCGPHPLPAPSYSAPGDQKWRLGDDVKAAMALG